MQSIFDDSVYQEVVTRIDNLRPDSPAKWGKMDVAQMLNHCRNPLAVGLGKQAFKKPNFFMKLLYKSFKSSLYDDKPWKPNQPTAKEYKVVTPKDFAEEKPKLLELVTEFHQAKNKTSWDPHPAFGDFTHEQWGKLQYKHLDHHLRQFGV
ncbi:DUF1569 domain-containing protein [Poritiphilus flavus]|uniref:DUF1569 domain-containing protein n=1 Tax=Poritiphilus flavus TaxID=2697053 RepID=A0A6L9EHI0_9FLAO|nr:DUF1569 domain-containing protein [Poritiphilus flavus]NAS14181.1 DUF1569 domain-containing protein [Poritiphilus flavus]